MSRTGEEILDSIYQQAINDGLINAKFEQGRLGLLFSVIAKEFLVFEQILENYIAEMTLSTANDPLSIELLSTPFHMRQPARISTVKLRFTKDKIIDDDYVIPYGTLVETSDINPIVYYTIEEKTLYKENDYVDIVAFSTEPGSSTIVLPNTLTVLVSNRMAGIYVTNPEASYGGRDQEDIETLRQTALAFRYQLERGSYLALEQELQDYGLEPKDFNLVENEFGMGSLAAYIDTTSDTIIEDVLVLLQRRKAEGVYLICEKVTSIPMEFDFDIQVSSPKSLLPEERNRLRAEISNIFTEYVDKNGVGKKLVISRLISYLYSQLSSMWYLSDIHLTIDGAPESLDDNGNVVLESWEVIQIEQLNIDIDTG